MILTPMLRDATADLVLHGYRFMDRLRAQSDDPKAPERLPLRILGGEALLVRGERGVELFYDDDLIQRDGAMPEIVGGGLFGEGSVHHLDDEAHLVRKQFFVRAALDKDAVAALTQHAQHEWEEQIEKTWLQGRPSSVYDAAVEVYGRSIIRWAGVETDRATATRLAHDEAAIVDGFGVVGPAFVKAKLKRRTCDEWFTDLVSRARAGEVTPRSGSAFDLVLQHIDADGEPLDDRLAAVELQNVIRPTIATARFAAFLALALHEHPEWRERVFEETAERGTTIDGPVAIAVAEEVRRFYPFVPLLPGVARKDFTFEGAHVSKGDRVLIDIYGTNRDERYWTNAHTFDPSRFLDTGEVFSDHFIPHGGGEVETGHRCPGEMIAVGLLALTVAELSRLDATLAAGQDLSFRMGRMPTMPRDGVVFARATRR
jgi:fatty-acid peroxygenase